MLAQIKQKVKEFPVYRKLRKDGNSLYRAFNFGFLEMALTHKSSLHFLKFLSVIADPTKVEFQTNIANRMITDDSNLSPQKMRAFVIHRLLILYSYRVTMAESNDPNWETKIILMLSQVFNEPPYCFDTFLIIGIKNYIIHHLKSLQQFVRMEESKSVIN